MAGIQIYLPDELAKRLDAQVQALSAGRIDKVSRSEIVQEALLDYLNDRYRGGRELHRTSTQLDLVDAAMMELRKVRRSLSARAGRESAPAGQQLLHNPQQRS